MSVREDGKARTRARRRAVRACRDFRRPLRPDDASDEVVVARLLNLDLDDLPGPRGPPVDVDLPVDLRRLSHPAAFEEQRGLLRDALDQDVERLPDQGRLMGFADLALDREKLLLPLRLHPGRNLAVELVRRRTFLAGELEDADALEAHLFDERAQFFELRVGFARESDDEARAEDESRYPLAKLLAELAQERRVPPALHPAPDRIANVLERHVEIPGEVRLGRERLDQLVRKVARVRVMQPDPARGHRRERGEQIVQARTSR